MASTRVLGSIAPCMHENGMTKVLYYLAEISPTFHSRIACRYISNAIACKKITSAEADILLFILSRASINRDLAFTHNPIKPLKIVGSSWSKRPREFLAIAFAFFDTFVEEFMLRHADSLTVDTLCYTLVDMCHICCVLEPANIYHQKSFWRTMYWLLWRLDILSKSCGADPDAADSTSAQMACVEVLNILETGIYYKSQGGPATVGQLRDIIPDIIATLSRAGANVDGRLCMGLQCSRDHSSLEPVLKVEGIIDYPCQAGVFMGPLNDFFRLLVPGPHRLTDYPRDFLILEMSVSFAIERAMAQCFGPGEDRPALVGHKEHPHQCHVIYINTEWFEPDEAKHNEDLSRLTSLLVSWLTEDPYVDYEECLRLIRTNFERATSGTES